MNKMNNNHSTVIAKAEPEAIRRKQYEIHLMNKVQVLYAGCLLLVAMNMAAQEEKSSLNPIYTGVPSLTIAPDARGGSMGDVGVATSPDMVSQYWNPAKLPFAWSKAGVQLSYTPWLRKLVSDIDLAYLSGYYKIGSEDNQAVGASIRYFSLGEVHLQETVDDIGMNINPYEMALDVSYSVKLTENFAGAVAFRYIRSDLGAGVVAGTDVGNAYAADVAGYYNKYVVAGSNECLLGLGFNISNIGTKISYNGGSISHFLPTNLRLGASYLMPLDDYNTLSLSLDLNKYLVPTPPDTRDIEDQVEKQRIEDEYKSISPITGIFKSFGDAPGGMKEELQEIMWSAGAEYAYNNQFFVRGGYFYEHPNKGNRQYFSLGAGFRMNVLQLDVAYLVATAASNPLDQTLRFSLTFDMDGLKGLLNR
jgi:hypothetical protein